MPITHGPPVLRVPVGRNGGVIPAPLLDWPNGQVINVGTGSGQSTVYAGPTQMTGNSTLWEVCATTNAWYTVGRGPTAGKNTAGSHYLPAGQLRYVYIPSGEVIAFTQDTAAGIASIVPALLST